MNPRHEVTNLFCSFQQLLSLCLNPLEGLFELTWRPSRAFNLDAYGVPGTKEIQRTLSGVTRQVWRPQVKVKTLFVTFLKTHLFSLIQKLREGPGPFHFRNMEGGAGFPIPTWPPSYYLLERNYGLFH